MRLLVGEIMVDRGRARGGQRVLEDGSSKKKALLCGVSEAISSRVLGDLLCKYVCARENPFFQPTTHLGAAKTPTLRPLIALQA